MRFRGLNLRPDKRVYTANSQRKLPTTREKPVRRRRSAPGNTKAGTDLGCITTQRDNSSALINQYARPTPHLPLSRSVPAHVQNETYEFPYVLVCFFEGVGCGFADGTTDQCVADALDLSTVHDRSWEELESVVVESMVGL